TGTEGDDTVRGYAGQIDSGDSIALGAGFDTLQMLSRNMDFHSADFMQFSGIDNLDVTASAGRVRLVIGDGFVDASDRHALTITYGDGGIGLLDTSGLNHARNKV